MQLSEHQKQLDTYYKTQAGRGFWIEKYKPYLSLYRDRLVKRNAAIAASLPDKVERVLDLGCGRGDLMAIFAPRAQTVVGTDLSDVMVRATRENLTDYKNVTMLCCPAESMPFADGSFEGIVIADVVEHLVDVSAALKECRRILKPGGRVVITTPNARMEHFWQKWDGALSLGPRLVGKVVSKKRPEKPPVFEYFFKPQELAGIAKSCGFNIYQHRMIEFYPGAEGGGTFGRILRLIACQKHLRQFIVEPVFRAIFNGIESLGVFNNRQLLVLEKPQN